MSGRALGGLRPRWLEELPLSDVVQDYISEEEDPEQNGYINDDKQLRTMQSAELRQIVADHTSSDTLYV